MDLKTVPTVESVSPEDLERVVTWLADHHAEMTAALQEYVEHETPSDDKECLTAGLAWIEEYLTTILGSPAGREITNGGIRGDMLQLEFRGSAPGSVLLLCHYDTVWDKGTLAEWPCTIEDDVMRGPGVLDMKAGLIQGAWAVRALDALGIRRPTVRFLCTGDEELGSHASRPTIEAAASDVSAVMVMEPSLDGALKTARKGVGIFTIDVHGIESHAGLDPTAGASAIDELARLVLYVRSLNDLAAGTTINIGMLHGGRRANVVAGHAQATVDVRVESIAEADRIGSAVLGLTPNDPRTRIEIGGGWNRPVMERTPAIEAMFTLGMKLAGSLGIILDEASAGGGSDANFLAHQGIPLLDGLGAVGSGAHSRDEHVRLEDTWERVSLVSALLASFGAHALSAP
jgi:glutamate carboxypeptidase